MGSSASSRKDAASNPATKLKQSFGSKMETMALPPPLAIKEDVANGDHLQPLPSPTQSTTTLGDYTFGNKSELFFDSQTWLESDCEDDFFSVRGDLTPFGNTPLHQNLFKPTPPPNLLYLDAKALDPIPQPPPANKKKKLFELFRDSNRENRGGGDDQNAPSSRPIEGNENPDFCLTFGDFFPKLRTQRSYVRRSKSVHIVQRADGGWSKENKDGNADKCCLQVMVSCRSFREKRRMRRHASQSKA